MNSNHWNSHPRLRGLRLALALLLTISLGLGMAQPALAASFVISDQASCAAFGGYLGSFNYCELDSLTVNAGDTLSIRMPASAHSVTNNGTLSFEGSGNLFIHVLTNTAGATLNGVGPVLIDDSGINSGTINISGPRRESGNLEIRGPFTNASTGLISLQGDTLLILNIGADVTNQGTILAACNVSVRNYGSPISGNQLQYPDCTPPSLTINQAAGQTDPTDSNPVRFSASFSEAVTGFTASDVSLSGTANLAGATVTISGGPTNYTVRVDGVAGNGTVIASIAANVASDAAGNGNIASTSTDKSVTFTSDKTGPALTPNIVGTLGDNGWYTSDVSVSWSVTDAESSISAQSGCDTSAVTSDTSGVTFTCSATSAGGTNSQAVTIKRDATKPTIAFSGRTAPNAAGWNNGPVLVQWSCSDATSGATSADVSQTVSAEGANQSASGTCTVNAGNSASDTQAGINIDTTAPALAPSVSPSSLRLGQSASAGPNASDALSGIASQSCAPLDTSSLGLKSVSCTATDLAGNSASASASYEVLPAFPTSSVLDSFNRANGAVGANWAGLTATSFYKVASNRLDVQLGGPLVWQASSFGADQEAFVTLSTLDPKSPSMGVLLKVQSGSIPNAGAISVVYDAPAKAVRVSALRAVQNGAWTLYPSQAATFASGDVLGARAKADGTLQIYKNGTLVTTVTLSAADQAFFNAKGGKIGIWSAAASNAILDDFGGGNSAL